MGCRDRCQTTDYDNPSTLDDFEAIHLRAKRDRHTSGECAGIDCPYCEYRRFLETETKAVQDQLKTTDPGGDLKL